MSVKKRPRRGRAKVPNAWEVGKVPKLPKLLKDKLYKTGQTRGADDDEIFQNRVLRSSTVLIPYPLWDLCALPPDGTSRYENGFIVLISPTDYFGTENIDAVLSQKGLKIGENALVFYETRAQWNANTPTNIGWTAAKARKKPLRGHYVARVPATTAESGKKLIIGFNTTKPKGAGIRVYEYASTATIAACRLQLEALFWACADSEAVALRHGMSAEAIKSRTTAILGKCKELKLLDTDQLTRARVSNAAGKTICPLCLDQLSGEGFLNRMEQAEGRLVHDLTITQLNLFHITELRFGVLNHRPYNLGWGHHHCNVVVKDAGILKTLEWMRGVVDRNIKEGHLPKETAPVGEA